MSSNARRIEIRKEREAAQEAQEIENSRVENLSLYERIEEITDIWDVRAVLHLMADKLGLDQWGDV